jgi:cation diffusion facilitator CzcD-associated flavoprotein CzcO
LRGFSVRSLSNKIMPNKTRVLILGGGFGGLYAALHLEDHRS